MVAANCPGVLLILAHAPVLILILLWQMMSYKLFRRRIQ